MNRSSSMEQDAAPSSPIARALAKVLKVVEEAEGNALGGKPGAVKVSIKADEGAPTCEACKAGKCMDPDHASEDMEQMLSEMGGE